MKSITVALPNITEDGSPSFVGGIVLAVTNTGLPGAQGEQGIKGDKGDKGDQGDPGPGILSNIVRITASVDPPEFPQENDLWIDLS